MAVIIGVDPHKASHTAVAIGDDERELAVVKVRATRRQVVQLLSWAAPFEKRTWAIESAGGLGYLLSQQLVAAGEDVVDVPATLASRVRVLGTGRSDKNDPNDARSVAIAALRAPALRPVEVADHAEVLRLLAKRNLDIGSHRTRIVRRLHAALADLAPGGITKELNASDAVELLARIQPASPVEQTRYDLAVELLDDVRRLDAQFKVSHKRIRDAVLASGTCVTELFGVGPSIACSLIGYSGDVTRFTNRDQFAAYNGTAPIEHSSAGRVVHRLSRRGNRRLNHAIHMAAICQIRQTNSEGRAYFERRVAEGKTKKEALRVLKRHVSTPSTDNSSLTRAAPGVDGPGRTSGNDSSASVVGSTSLEAGSSVRSLPGPDNTLRPTAPHRHGENRTRPRSASHKPFDTKRIRSEKLANASARASVRAAPRAPNCSRSALASRERFAHRTRARSKGPAAKSATSSSGSASPAAFRKMPCLTTNAADAYVEAHHAAPTTRTAHRRRLLSAGERLNRDELHQRNPFVEGWRMAR